MGRGVPANSVLVSCIQGSDPLVLVGSQVNKAGQQRFFAYQLGGEPSDVRLQVSNLLICYSKS